MASLSRLLTLLIAFVLMPGSAEVVESTAHLVSDGHTAHAVDDTDHAPKGDEHGCSGSFHVCPCHSTTSFVVGDAMFAAAPVPVVLDPRLTVWTAGRPADGYGLGVYRPPSA